MPKTSSSPKVTSSSPKVTSSSPKVTGSSLLAQAEKVEPQEHSRSSYYTKGEGSEILEVIAKMRENGCSYRQIAEFLNEHGCSNARGGKFTIGSVTNLYSSHFEEEE